MWTPADFVRDLPIGRFVLDCCMAFYMNRSSEDASLRDKNVMLIKERQELIENSELNYPPLHVFVESCCSNGLYLHKFRRGAFIAEKPIQPYILNYEWKLTHPGFDTVKGLQQGMLLVTELRPKMA